MAEKRPSPVMTLHEAAAYLNIGESTLYRMIKAKKISGYKIGRDWRFNRESLDRWRMQASAKR